ncbi:MAG: hypothetical protein WCH10_02280 [bacterium]
MLHYPTGNYTVTVTAAKSPNCAITAYSISNQTSCSIDAKHKTIAVTVPFPTPLTALIATFTKSDGSTAEVGDNPQISGTTPNDFTSPVTYTVTAEDDITSSDYTVIVTKNAPQVGQDYGGGTIVSVDATNRKILICSKNDIAQTVWSEIYTPIFANAGCLSRLSSLCQSGTYYFDEIGSGKPNTELILKTLGIDRNSAAKHCTQYREGGYTDWYLPSMWELYEVYKIFQSPVAGYHWSSTVDMAHVNRQAITLNFDGANWSSDDFRRDTINIRAVRNENY